MNDKSIDRATAEAKRFLERAKEWKAATKDPDWIGGDGYKYYPSAPKQSGALRRASLDLTRALAEMRKP